MNEKITVGGENIDVIVEDEENGDGVTENGDGVTEIADDLLSNMPEPSEFVIEKAEREADEHAANPLIDDSGTIFDADKHAVNKNGEPYYTKLGKFRRKKSPNGQGTSTKTKSQINVDTPMAAVNSADAAKMAAELIVTIGTQIGGEEWKPIINEEYGLNEFANMKDSFQNYFDAKGIVDFPPGIALTIALGSYALPRFRMPKTKSRISVITSWVKQKIAKWQGKL